MKIALKSQQTKRKLLDIVYFGMFQTKAIFQIKKEAQPCQVPHRWNEERDHNTEWKDDLNNFPTLKKSLFFWSYCQKKMREQQKTFMHQSCI